MRNILKIIPGSYAVWQTEAGHTESMLVQAMYLEMGKGWKLIGLWAEKPTPEEIQEAKRVVLEN